jgi:hypothetical protein
MHMNRQRGSLEDIVWRVARLCAQGACMALVSGCAVSYVDESGAMRVVGFVSMTVQSGGPQAAGARSVSIRNLGLSAMRSDLSSSISLGYNSENITVINNDACVSIERAVSASPAWFSPGEKK